MKSTFDKRTPQDDIDDLRYFWSKTEDIVKRLEKAGYIINLNPGRVDARESSLLQSRKQERNRQQPKERDGPPARAVPKGKAR